MRIRFAVDSWTSKPLFGSVVSGRPLKVGFVILAGQGGHAGTNPRWSDILALAQSVEAVGFDSLWIPDHLLHVQQEVLQHFDQPAPEEWVDQPAVGWWDTWTLLTAIAASTNRITIGPLVACTAYRNPALLAKMAATLDEVSDGRLILGLGAGDAPGEFRAFGYPLDHPVSRFEEAITIIADMLKTGESTFNGAYLRTEGCELRLRGPSPHGPPVMISAKGPRMLEIAARYADAWNGWIVFDRSHPDTLNPVLAALDSACERGGRDPATLQRTVGVAVCLPGERAPAGQPITGTPQEIAESLAAFAEIGISHVQVLMRTLPRDGIESFVPVLEILDQG